MALLGLIGQVKKLNVPIWLVQIHPDLGACEKISLNSDLTLSIIKKHRCVQIDRVRNGIKMNNKTEGPIATRKFIS